MPAKTFDTILKYNHNHDALGRFSESSGAGSGGSAAAGKNLNKIVDGKITMTYVKVTGQNTQNYGGTYGQNLEPKGEYMSMDTLKGGSKIPGFEYGTIHFEKPLIIDYKDSGPTGWKKDLSEKYKGKTGKRLSNALIKDGYDAVMTRDEDGNFVEIVNLNGKKMDSSVGKSFASQLKPTVQTPDRVEYWKKEIQAGHDRPILVGAEDKSRILDGNHTMTAYKELGRTPKIYEMDENTFWNESAGYKDKLDYVKQAIKEGKAKEVRKSATFDEVLKFNHNHGADGKFTTSEGAGAGGSSGGSTKERQLAIIQSSNPMHDDYHTGIRDVSDILTAKEAFDEDEFGGTPDWSYEDAQNAIKAGKITLYSSKPIENGAFVSPSKMVAQDYAGGGKVNSKTVSIDDVAWIDSEQGQYAKIQKSLTERDMNEFEIYKTDDDKHLVFGWASVAIKVDGEVLEDMQHDMIDPEDLEEAAYEYVLNFRDTGEEHLPGYRKKGKLVESCVFTPEKQKAMGIPQGTLPVAWWIGFKIEDEDAWQRVKNGTYRMFSIEGKAERQEVEKSDRTARTLEEVLKFNPYHGYHGYFSSANNATSMTAFTNSPAGQKAIQNVKAKQKAWDDFYETHSRDDTYTPTLMTKDGKYVVAANPGVKDAAEKGGWKEVKSGSKKQPKQSESSTPESTGPVTGKDISDSFEYDHNIHLPAPPNSMYPNGRAMSAIDQVAAAQGFNGKPTVVPHDEFLRLAKENGMVGFRTVSDGNDIITGEEKSSREFADTLLHGDSKQFVMNGEGMQAYGGGIYTTSASGKKGAFPRKAGRAHDDSLDYGVDNPSLVSYTLSPKAKVGDYYKVLKEFYNLPTSTRDRFNKDVGAYAAAKGYDALHVNRAGYSCDYTLVYNRTMMIFSEDIYTQDADAPF